MRRSSVSAVTRLARGSGQTLFWRSALPGLVATVVAGCASVESFARAQPIAAERASTERKVVRSGDLTVSVDDTEGAARDVESLVEEAGGFVERSTSGSDSTVSIHCRVPSARLLEFMDRVAGLGREARRTVSAVDVTDQYADLETRLRNNIALRDRLRQLLERAADVDDVLAIEKELNRVQSEIESMQARFDRLRSAIELSELSVTLRRERLLGPLGYVGYGLWWVLSKLFVIR